MHRARFVGGARLRALCRLRLTCNKGLLRSALLNGEKCENHRRLHRPLQDERKGRLDTRVRRVAQGRRCYAAMGRLQSPPVPSGSTNGFIASLALLLIASVAASSDGSHGYLPSGIVVRREGDYVV